MWGFDNYQKRAIIGCFVSMSILFIGSMLYVINDKIHMNESLTELNEKCGEFPTNVSYLKLQKNVHKFWKWTYDFTLNGIDGEIMMRCPSVQKDFDVYYNGSVGGTDGKNRF